MREALSFKSQKLVSIIINCFLSSFSHDFRVSIFLCFYPWWRVVHPTMGIVLLILSSFLLVKASKKKSLFSSEINCWSFPRRITCFCSKIYLHLNLEGGCCCCLNSKSAYPHSLRIKVERIVSFKGNLWNWMLTLNFRLAGILFWKHMPALIFVLLFKEMILFLRELSPFKLPLNDSNWKFDKFCAVYFNSICVGLC